MQEEYEKLVRMLYCFIRVLVLLTLLIIVHFNLASGIIVANGVEQPVALHMIRT